MSERQTYTRSLYCPICGQRVEVKTDCVKSEVHVLPEHVPKDAVNACQCLEVVVTLRFPTCDRCGRNTMKTPLGFCVDCFDDLDHLDKSLGGRHE